MRRVLHWFRRDLRVSDNTALCCAAKQAGEVSPSIFFLPGSKMTHGPIPSGNSFFAVVWSLWPKTWKLWERVSSYAQVIQLGIRKKAI
jgi:deoxyribodipyrimidine photolyase